MNTTLCVSKSGYWYMMKYSWDMWYYTYDGRHWCKSLGEAKATADDLTLSTEHEPISYRAGIERLVLSASASAALDLLPRRVTYAAR